MFRLLFSIFLRRSTPPFSVFAAVQRERIPVAVNVLAKDFREAAICPKAEGRIV